MNLLGEEGWDQTSVGWNNSPRHRNRAESSSSTPRRSYRSRRPGTIRTWRRCTRSCRSWSRQGPCSSCERSRGWVRLVRTWFVFRPEIGMQWRSWSRTWFIYRFPVHLNRLQIYPVHLNRLQIYPVHLKRLRIYPVHLNS